MKAAMRQRQLDARNTLEEARADLFLFMRPVLRKEMKQATAEWQEELAEHVARVDAAQRHYDEATRDYQLWRE